MTGGELKKLRVRMGLTQKEMAEMLGFSGKRAGIRVCELERKARGHSNVSKRVEIICFYLRQKRKKWETAQA